MLFFDCNGVAMVMEGYELIIAHLSQYMSALGCILYYLSSAQSVFHVNEDDNLCSDKNYETMYYWEASFKEKRLAAISDKLAKILVSSRKKGP